MKIQGKKVLVIGSGKSGIGASRLLGSMGAYPVLFDGNDKQNEEEIRQRAGQIPGLTILLGSVPEEIKKEIVLVVISPGVPVDAPMLEEYRALRIPIWGEIELAYAYAKGSVVAITGTNGKTTTTTLVGQIMEAYYRSVYVVGNIGNPYTEIALETKNETVTVAEISSFQLETIHTFKPAVSAILNITPDHLNRHHTMECYVRTKEAITRYQTKEDTCVLNYEDPYTRDFGDRCPAKVVFFSSKRKLETGVYLDGEEICMAEELPGKGIETQRLMNIHDMNLVGKHIEKGFRKALLVMATGTGKTRTASSLTDILSRGGYITNILFLADRTALVKQAKDDFKNYLPDMSLCNLCSNKDDKNARIVFSTYPTILNAIDSAKTRDGVPLFSPAHFDLIITDESHRSIFRKYRAIFEYFDAITIGLTATPKTDVDRNTYDFFEMESGVPTYAYDYETAVYSDLCEKSVLKC